MFFHLRRTCMVIALAVIGANAFGISSTSSLSPAVAHASVTLTASPNNPYRAKLATGYAERADRVVTNILARGSDLSTSQYTVYLTTISNGIQTLGQKPVYAGNPDVVNVIGYLQHEVDAIKTQLSNGSLFMDELTRMLEGSLATARATPAGGTTNTQVTIGPAPVTAGPTFGPAPAVVTTPAPVVVGPAPVVTTTPTFGPAPAVVVGPTFGPAPAVVVGPTPAPAPTTVSVQASSYSRVIEYFLCGNKEEVNGTISGVRLTASYNKSQFAADSRPIGVSFDRDEYGRPNGNYAATSYGDCNQICRGTSANYSTLCGQARILQSTEDLTVELPKDTLTLEVTKTQVQAGGESVAFYGYVPAGTSCTYSYSTVNSVGSSALMNSVSAQFLVQQGSYIRTVCNGVAKNFEFTESR